jgi:hypothetical protein
MIKDKKMIMNTVSMRNMDTDMDMVITLSLLGIRSQTRITFTYTREQWNLLF